MKKIAMHTCSELVMLLCLFVVLFGIKGCRKNRSLVNPNHSRPHELSLKLAGDSDLQAKATGLMLTIEGLDDDGVPTGKDVIEESYSAPKFPLNIPVMLYDPPCR